MDSLTEQDTAMLDLEGQPVVVGRLNRVRVSKHRRTLDS